MKINRLKVSQFRNISDTEIIPDDSVNIIYGENGEGKTNLLEAMWLFTGCKSFRGANDASLVRFNQEFARLELDFYASRREQQAVMLIDKKRSAKLNEVKLKSAAGLMGEFYAVIFSPMHLSLIQDGPYDRRRFLDISLCQMKPAYAKALAEYNHILHQRNTLLKDIIHHSELLDTLEIWDQRLGRSASLITQMRQKYIDALRIKACEIYSGISSDKEKLDISYDIRLPSGLSFDGDYIRLFEQSRREDIKNGCTQIGPHRDDIIINLDGISARSFGSQGQQRSAALSLKLGEAEIIKEHCSEKPVALLDDVMSELDSGRQDYILNHLDGWQVFITCCEKATVQRLCSGKTFFVKGGAVIKES